MAGGGWGLVDQLIQVETQRAHVLSKLLRGFLEGKENARLAEPRRSLHEELHAEEGFPAPGAPANQGGAASRKATPSDFIEALDARRALGQGPPVSRNMILVVSHRSKDKRLWILVATARPNIECDS